MVFLWFFPIELAFLFFLSRVLTKSISEFFLGFTKNRKTTIRLLSFLFLPGVIVHELSHFFTASILFVPVGEIEFMPKVSEDKAKLGSVTIGKTDPIRRVIIGASPFIVGLSLILGSLFYFNMIVLPIQQTLKAVLEFFIVFEIGNTMFSSGKDLEGTFELLAVIVLVAAALSFIGVRLLQSIPDYVFSAAAIIVFKKIDLWILVPIGLDLLVIGALRLIQK